MRLIKTTVAAVALLSLSPAFAEKYPVKKDAVNPDYEQGQIWDTEYLKANADTYMGWCRGAKEMYPGITIDIDWKSFEAGFDHEMQKPKVRDRIEQIPPWNPCDHFCNGMTFDGMGPAQYGLPDNHAPGVKEEFQSKVTKLVCRYEVPNAAGTERTRLEYDPKTKTMTGIFSVSKKTDWGLWQWMLDAYKTPLFKKEFPAVAKWLASH
jgi:hypothetical protein